ncbi:MAG: hypothetical protein M1829_002322 [Trizodia sp. TS-e1964]|nr:MAG: hypothetical protein M1829_002322 [Trizodia sp. TS-e1964]
MHSFSLFASAALLASAAFAAPAALADPETPAMLLAPAAELEKRTLRTTSTNQDIINRMLLAPTGRQRVEILTNDNDFSFDFRFPPTSVGNSTGFGGSTIVANRNTMPGLIGTGSSMTVGFLKPCGMNTPHTHPRGTELNIVVAGSLVTTFIAENGARVVKNNATAFQMNVFPQGALHMEYNPDCTDAIFVAAFNNEDAATLASADAFFELESNVIRASLGGDVTISGQNINQIRGKIPANVARGVEECLVKCGLPRM